MGPPRIFRLPVRPAPAAPAMASDDPAPDASAPRSDRAEQGAGDAPRFTTRTFLMPDDDADSNPGDGASAPLPEESFGTGEIDDAALDAAVQDTGADFVWSAADLAPPAPADPSEFLIGEMPKPTAADFVDEPLTPTGDAGERGRVEGVLGDPEESRTEAAYLEIADERVEPPVGAVPADSVEAPEPSETDPGTATEPSADAAEVEGTTTAEDGPVPDVPQMDAATDSDEPADAPQEGNVHGILGSITAAGAGMLSALADVVHPDDDPAPPAEPDSAVDDSPDTDSMTTTDPMNETEMIAEVDQAFDAESDAEKSDQPSADGIEGDLEVAELGPDDFEPDELRHVLRTMMTSRRLDEKMLTLLKQGKGFFHIGSAGHEASQIAVASQFEGGRDWFCFYYRDLGTALQVGVSPREVLQAHFGKPSDPFGGGRQMPEHFGHRALNIMSTSSSVGAQFVPAVGFALAIQKDGTPEGEPTKAVYTSGGEGSTSQGAFHEALNWAARQALPVLFHVQDNKYAISVPVEEQTAGGSIWHLLGGYAGLKRLRYDGTDYFQSIAAARAAMAHIRAGHGPVALHADVVRLFPHSSSDDHRKYRETASIEADAARDPLAKLVRQLTEAGVVTEDEVEAMRAEIAADIDRLAREVEAEPNADPATATQHVYYEGPDEREYHADGDDGDLVVIVDAINHALDEEMARDDKVLVYGEDVGGGKGGVFTATRGLAAKYGKERCFNSPLAEHSVIGSAVGLAAAGYKPVIEIQFADYIWPGMQPLRNQVMSMRYRSNGEWANPMVIRVPCGGYIHGGLCHSQNVEAMFGHFPGLQVVMPSNAADAKGMLKSAIRGEDPVIFLEHKALYRQGPARRPEPHADYLVPFGKAAVAREGADLTIVTWGAIVYKSLNVAKTLEKEGVSVEVIDIRSMLPFDSEGVLASARKTGRVLVAYEDHEFMGFGAEIAAQISDAAFGDLDAPVKRVAGAFTSIPYADPLETAVLPQDDDVLAAAREVLAY